MKIVPKNEDHYFRTKATLEALCHNAKPINEDVRNGNYRIEGENNALELFFDNNKGNRCFCVFCQFDKPNELTNLNGVRDFYSSYGCQKSLREFNAFLRESIKQL